MGAHPETQLLTSTTRPALVTYDTSAGAPGLGRRRLRNGAISRRRADFE
jgi:hypothetical protein